MLTAATNLVCDGTRDSSDAAMANALAHVRVKEVAQEATRMVRAQTGDENAPAISIGSIYQMWPLQADFQADLLFHIAEQHAALVPDLPESIRIFEESLASGAPVTEVVRRVLEVNHQHNVQSATFRVVLSFFATVANARVREALARLDEKFMTVVCEAWQRMLDAYGLRVRPPYTVQHFATSMAALLNGFHLRAIANPEGLGDPEGDQEWSLVTRTAVMLFEQFTEPAGEPSNDRAHQDATVGSR
jgi:hypothetical protein